MTSASHEPTARKLIFFLSPLVFDQTLWALAHALEQKERARILSKKFNDIVFSGRCVRTDTRFNRRKGREKNFLLLACLPLEVTRWEFDGGFHRISTAAAQRSIGKLLRGQYQCQLISSLRVPSKRQMILRHSSVPPLMKMVSTFEWRFGFLFFIPAENAATYLKNKDNSEFESNVAMGNKWIMCFARPRNAWTGEGEREQATEEIEGDCIVFYEILLSMACRIRKTRETG